MSPAPAGFDVSRETAERLDTYADLLRKWNPRINLIAPGSVQDIWSRHIIDSAQLFDLAPGSAASWADLGSGGGLPGLVCAILSADAGAETDFILVESDQRKAAFLSTAVRELGLDNTTVCAERIEAVNPLWSQIVTARALAPLSALLRHVERHLAPGGIALLPKGAQHADELTEARKTWSFTWRTEPSRTDPRAAIYLIEGLSRV